MLSATSENGYGHLALRASALCMALGYDARPTFYNALAGFDRKENLHVVTTAFEVIGVHSVFGIAEGATATSFKPVVYVGLAVDDEAAIRLHRSVWTQGAVPFLIVVTPEAVQIRNAFEPPGTNIPSYPYKSDVTLPPELTRVSAVALTSSIYWRDFSTSRASAIDTRLVSTVEKLNEYVRSQYPALIDRRGLLNALIGRLLYLYVLVDRLIVSRDWMAAVIIRSGCVGVEFSSDALFKGVRTGQAPFQKEEVWAVLDGIDDLINGSVFPISDDERCILPEDLIHLVHRVVRCGDVVDYGKHQISFLDVSFKVLRTETISAIYERFLKIEDEGAQRSEGAFYTPPFLADYVVERVDQEIALSENSRVLDPAAGSGVFLVSAYRRIMERNAPPGGWKPVHAAIARGLLCASIHGVEKNPQAVNICRFSLYLTMLDYVGGADIVKLARIVGEKKLLPCLDRNIITANAFRSDLFPTKQFTHVIGNPPWAQPGRQGYDRNHRISSGIRTDSDREEFAASLGRDRPIAHGRVSDMFVWLTDIRFLVEGGVLGLVLPTRSFVGRQSGRFASAFAATMAIRFIANLSHLRRRLFFGAESPAMVVVARKDVPRSLDIVEIYRPRLSSLPLGKTGQIWSLLVSQTDLHPVRSHDLRFGVNGWLSATMLGVFDRRMRDALSTWSSEGDRTFGQLLNRSSLRMQRGGDPGETGVPHHILPGRKKPEGLFALNANLFSKVTDAYRPLFSGGTVLVPRNFRKSRVLDTPHAYRSTYYGIAPAHRWTTPQSSPPFDSNDCTTIVYEDERAGLLGLTAFLNSGVAAYFASIFGATFLMDNARMEKGDISALPCPYKSTQDPALRALAKALNVDDLILDAMKAGSDLRTAVRDYVCFNAGFTNAQLPGAAYNVVSDREIKEFVDRFKRELQGNFTENFRPTIIQGRRCEGTITLWISFGASIDLTSRRGPGSDGTFIASSVITFEHDIKIGAVTKSEAQFAWMPDQAVSDAEAFIRLLRVHT